MYVQHTHVHTIHTRTHSHYYTQAEYQNQQQQKRDKKKNQQNYMELAKKKHFLAGLLGLKNEWVWEVGYSLLLL